MTRRCDPCADLQADISALLDHELDDARVRRVLVHIEVCPSCSAFMRSLGKQLDLHRELWQRELGQRELGQKVDARPEAVDDPFSGDLFADATEDDLALIDISRAGGDDTRFLDEMLAESSERLGEVLYQLGRAYVLLSVSPEFVRHLSREPVPIPEYRLRGKALLDGADSSRTRWAEASELLGGRLDSCARNLERGRLLLVESLRLRPDSIRAHVMLGQCHMQRFELDQARAEFERVLTETPDGGGPTDPKTGVPLRIYALESLGNICLVEGRADRALELFRSVRDSRAMDIHPNFSTAYLNIGDAALRAGRFDEAVEAYERHYDRYPERRELTAQSLAIRVDLRRIVDQNLAARERLAQSCPLWFGPNARLSNGTAVTFDVMPDTAPRIGHGDVKLTRGGRSS